MALPRKTTWSTTRITRDDHRDDHGSFGMAPLDSTNSCGIRIIAVRLTFSVARTASCGDPMNSCWDSIAVLIEYVGVMHWGRPSETRTGPGLDLALCVLCRYSVGDPWRSMLIPGGFLVAGVRWVKLGSSTLRLRAWRRARSAPFFPALERCHLCAWSFAMCHSWTFALQR